jgi:hypothetical protein
VQDLDCGEFAQGLNTLFVSLYSCTCSSFGA